MSVLARDVDAYNRALAAYQRKAGTFNKGVDQYNASMVRDSNENPYVYQGEYDPIAKNYGNFYTADKTSGKLTGTIAPAGYAGITAIADSPGFSMVRQNPTSTQTKTRADVYKNAGGFDEYGNKGAEFYYVIGPPDAEGNGTQKILNPDKIRVIDQKEGAEIRDGNGDIARAPTTYTIEYDENSFADRPPDWNETFDKKAPDPTKAQIRQASRPSLAQQEAGLVGEVIRARGLKTGSGGLIKSQMEAPAAAAATTGPTPEERAAAEAARVAAANDR